MTAALLALLQGSRDDRECWRPGLCESGSDFHCHPCARREREARPGNVALALFAGFFLLLVGGVFS